MIVQQQQRPRHSCRLTQPRARPARRLHALTVSMERGACMWCIHSNGSRHSRQLHFQKGASTDDHPYLTSTSTSIHDLCWLEFWDELDEAPPSACRSIQIPKYSRQISPY